MTHSSYSLIAYLASTTLCLTLSSVVSGCASQAEADVADDGAAVAASVAQNAIAPNAATPEPTATASVSSRAEAVVCYHYFGGSPFTSTCHSFWFDHNLGFLRKNCAPGPCNPFPNDWPLWSFWGDGSDNVLCAGAWWPSESQRQQLRGAYEDAPNC